MCYIQNNQFRRRGIAFLTGLIFLVVFLSFSAVMLQRSAANVAAAASMHYGNEARAVAESGLEVVRYWLKDFKKIDDYTLAKEQLCDYVLQRLDQQLKAKGVDCELITNDSKKLIVRSFSLGNNRSFQALFYQGSNKNLTVEVTGVLQNSQQVFKRTIRSGYTFGMESKISPYVGIDFGVATKSPLKLGNLSIDGFEIVNGVQARVATDVYIESLNQELALEINNAQISGDAKIANPYATVSISGGQSSIGGEKGVAALNHVVFGVEAVDFPIPQPEYFEKYATGIVIDQTNKGLYSTNATLVNVRIAPNTNPKFTGNVNILGVMYIEQPNTVEFAGNAVVTGIIAANGTYSEQSAPSNCKIDFTGTVKSYDDLSVSARKDYDKIIAQHADKISFLYSEKGTFLMAPGFSVSFGGNFGTINGAIIANGIKTYGNAGGIIKGSVINYDKDNVMELGGKDLRFDRTNKNDLPAGFRLKQTQYWVMYYSPAEFYQEIVCAD